MTRSFVANYWSTEEGQYLLGGVKRSTSCRFQRKRDAEDRLQGVVDVHRPGLVAGEVVESPLVPEIFVHCAGAVPQAIGGRCEKCRKILTVTDARNTKPDFGSNS